MKIFFFTFFLNNEFFAYFVFYIVLVPHISVKIIIYHTTKKKKTLKKLKLKSHNNMFKIHFITLPDNILILFKSNIIINFT